MKTHAMIDALEHRRMFAKWGLDATFANGGDAQVSSDAYLASLPDGKILAVSTSSDPKRVERLNNDGSLDTSFGDGGVAGITKVGLTGSETIAGMHLVLTDGTNASYLSLEALNLSDGSEDLSFGNNGLKLIFLGSTSVMVTSTAAGPNGTTYLAIGTTHQDPDDGSFSSANQILRLTPTGQEDETFGSEGYVTLPDANNVSLAAEPDGGVLAACDNGDASEVLRFDAEGKYDFPFNDQIASALADKRLVGDFPFNIAFQSDGKIILEMTAYTPSDTTNRVATTLVRFTDSGALDKTFGSAGIVQIASVLNPMVIDSENRIIVASNSAIYRFAANGKVDLSFNDTGTLDFGIDHSIAILAVDDLDRLLIGSDEQRTFRLAPIANVSLGRDGMLRIDGTDSGDMVGIKVSGSSVIASLNGEKTTFDVSAVKTVQIDTGEGDDLIDAAIDVDVVITAGSGDDSITTAGGDDRIHAGDGDNVVHAGDGHDFIQAGAGSDSLYGHAGSDTIRGGAGNDLISGGGGRDHLFGQQGKDRLYGGNGNDILNSGPGSDRLDGGTGSDYLAAGPGDDTITANDGEADSVYGGDGNDSAQIDSGLDQLRSIETIL